MMFFLIVPINLLYFISIHVLLSAWTMETVMGFITQYVVQETVFGLAFLLSTVLLSVGTFLMMTLNDVE